MGSEPPNPKVDGTLGFQLETDTKLGTAATELEAEPRVPGLTILYHPRLERIGERVALPALGSGRTVALSRIEPGFAPPAGHPLRPLAEPHLSRQPLRLEPGAAAGAVSLSRGRSRTRVEIAGRPLDDARHFEASELEDGVVLLLGSRVVLLLHRLDPRGGGDVAASDLGLIGESASLVRLRAQIRRLASLDVPVLLRGETGTGKELVARALHRAGARRGRSFVALNMAAIPPSLAAAELFGSVRGAYTGATGSRLGAFRQADGGTLFLDEVGDTPPEVQALLLRALETREVRPVGSDVGHRVDARLIAATDAALESAVAAERFRAPLLHRLSGYPLHLAPLRERREDVGRLLRHFLLRELEAHGRPATEPPAWLTAARVARLASYSWPGNVRQLQNVVRQLAIAGDETGARGDEVLIEEILRTTLDREPSTAGGVGEGGEGGEGVGRDPRPPPAVTPRRRPATIDEDELAAALEAVRWRPEEAAQRLGISRPSLYALIARSERLRVAGDLDRAEIEAACARVGDDLDALADELRVSRRGLARRMRALGMEPDGTSG